jgi:aspartate/methionine/tyrosine aminotransferase
MNFESVAYMEWAKLRSAAPINLCQSGVPGLSLRDLPVGLDGCDINGDHAYGYPPLLEAIAARAGAHPNNVVPSLGASEAVFLACAALLDRGDRVLVEKPGYEPFVSCARAVGAEIHRWERRFENGYGLDLDEFEEAIPDRTKLVLMTNLHNPSGALLPREDVRALAEAAGKRGAMVFIDEIYLDYLDGDRARTAFGAADNIFTASSLTKVYGLSGLRCGWIVAPAPLAQTLRRLVDHLFVLHVFIAEQIAARLFPHLGTIKERNRALHESNRRTVADFIAAEPRLSWVEPPGGILGFPRVEGIRGGDALAEALKTGYGTAVVPGGFFDDPRHFRIGWGVPADILARGLANISSALRG